MELLFLYLEGLGLTQPLLMWSGGPPFAQVPVTELLQYLQSGKYLKQPSTCSSSLWVQRQHAHITKQLSVKGILGPEVFIKEHCSPMLLKWFKRDKCKMIHSSHFFCRYSIMKSCGHYSPQRRLSTSQLINVLHTGETSADGRRPLRVTEPLNFDRYTREAGLREAADSAFLWSVGIM